MKGNKISVDVGESILLEVKEGIYRWVSYETLVKAAKFSAGKSRPSKNAGTKFSRQVTMAEHAVRTGTWATGAEVDVTKVLERLGATYMNLSKEEISHITENGLRKLTSIVSSNATGAMKPMIAKMIKGIMDSKESSCA